MPNEPEALNYIRGYGTVNNVPEMKIISMKEITANLGDFDDDEMARFNSRFMSIFKWMNREGIPPIVTQAHYEATLLAARNAKVNTFKSENFTGDGVNGWGMFDIVSEDVQGNALDRTWEMSNGLVATNWQVGVAATHWTRNDMGFAARDTVAFPAGAGFRPLDAAQDVWAVAYFGLADLAAVGLIQGHVYGLGNRERSYTEFTHQMQMGNITYNDLGQMIYIAGTDNSMKSAHIIRPVTVAPGARIAQVEAMKPVGVSFISQTRATQQAALPGPLTA